MVLENPIVLMMISFAVLKEVVVIVKKCVVEMVTAVKVSKNATMVNANVKKKNYAVQEQLKYVVMIGKYAV